MVIRFTRLVCVFFSQPPCSPFKSSPPTPTSILSQVLARSSPEDKYLLVTRLNGGAGGAMPQGQEEWETLHPDKVIDDDRLCVVNVVINGVVIAVGSGSTSSSFVCCTSCM